MTSKRVYPRMTIVVPKLHRGDCVEFTCCARLVEVPKELKKQFLQKRHYITSVGRGSERLFVRCLIGVDGHVHIDVVRPSYFESGKTPTRTSSWSEIQNELAGFQGHNFRVHVTAIFELSAERLSKSSFGSLLTLESRSSTVSMRLTGGTLSVTGAAIKEISWTKNDGVAPVEIKLLSVVDSVIDELYLSRPFDSLSHSFRAIVLGDEKV